MFELAKWGSFLLLHANLLYGLSIILLNVNTVAIVWTLIFVAVSMFHLVYTYCIDFFELRDLAIMVVLYYLALPLPF